MPRTDSFVNGAPAWVEYIPADIEKIKPFYKAVLNWDFNDIGAEMGHYNLVTVNGDVVGGCMQHDAAMMGETVNYFSIYLTTDDLVSSLQKSDELGGTTYIEPTEVPGQGQFAFVGDKENNSFSLWQAGGRKGYDRFGEHGFPAWFELHTRAFDANSAYYSDLFAADLGADEMGEGMRYHTLYVEGEPYFGIWDVTDVMPAEAPTGWRVYYFVDDTDAAVANAEQAGGSVAMPPQDTPYGRMSTVVDPGGTELHLIGPMPES